MDLSGSVREELGHGEGVCVCVDLLSDTLQTNGRGGTDTKTGVWLCNKPTDLSGCVNEESEEELVYYESIVRMRGVWS